MTLTPRFIPGTAVENRKGSGWSADTSRVADASLITPPVTENVVDHRLTLWADIHAGLALELIASPSSETLQKRGAERTCLSVRYTKSRKRWGDSFANWNSLK